MYSESQGNFFPVVGHNGHTLYIDTTRGMVLYLLRCIVSDSIYQLYNRTVLVLNRAVSIIYYIRYCVCKALLCMQHNLQFGNSTHNFFYI